jgi:hypothetical protein
LLTLWAQNSTRYVRPVASARAALLGRYPISWARARTRCRVASETKTFLDLPLSTADTVMALTPARLAMSFRVTDWSLDIA